MVIEKANHGNHRIRCGVTTNAVKLHKDVISMSESRARLHLFKSFHDERLEANRTRRSRFNFYPGFTGFWC